MQDIAVDRLSPPANATNNNPVKRAGTKLAISSMRASLEASKPTFADTIRDSLVNFRNGAVVVAILVLIGAGVLYLFRGLLSQPITPEEFARFRYAASGSFQTPEGINENSSVLGAKIVVYTSDRPGFEVKHLINEYLSEDYPGWRSATAAFPQDVVVQHDQATTISKVLVALYGRINAAARRNSRRG